MKLGSVQEAAIKLEKGDVIGMPTETVYGLAGRIDIKEEIEKIFLVKKRPFFDPLIVHVNSIEQAKTLTTDWSLVANELALTFWPGPLTLVLPKSDKVSDLITSGLQSVGIRMPNHPLALELLQKIRTPLAAPSANRFGRTSPTSALHVLSEFPDYDSIVIDGGLCEIGLESTVLSIQSIQKNYKFQLSILRSGAILESQISEHLIKKNIPFEFVEETNKRLAPGQMKHHYMPEIPLIVIDSKNISQADILKIAQEKIHQMPDIVEGVEIRKPKEFKKAREIKLPIDARMAARSFYSLLREEGHQHQADLIYIIISEWHHSEEWRPLKDRLYKAASIVF